MNKRTTDFVADVLVPPLPLTEHWTPAVHAQMHSYTYCIRRMRITVFYVDKCKQLCVCPRSEITEMSLTRNGNTASMDKNVTHPVFPVTLR